LVDLKGDVADLDDAIEFFFKESELSQLAEAFLVAIAKQVRRCRSR
jgi:hypothetical protein